METLVREIPSAVRRNRAPQNGTVVAIVTFLAVLLAAEIGARALAERIEDPQGWNVPGIAEHLERMDALDTAGEDVDTLLVGSSVVGQGLDPGLLAEVSAATGTAYNLHGPGFSARSLRVLVQDVGRQFFDPRTVVIGVSSRELNDAGDPQDRQHEILRSSPALDRLAGREDVAGRFERWVGEQSTFFRLREIWRRPALLNRMLKMGPDNEPDLGTYGMELPDKPGFETKPAHVAQERSALHGFAVGGDETTALRELINALQDDGVRVVLVNMPVYDEAYLPLHPEGERSYERYEAVLAALVDQTGVAYVDGTGLEWGRQWFANENHLNLRGAARMTRLVAAQLDRMPPAAMATAREEAITPPSGARRGP